MSDSDERETPLAQLKGQLSDEFARAAADTSRGRRTPRRRAAMAGVALTLIAVPSALALRSASEDDPTVPAPAPLLSPAGLSGCEEAGEDFLLTEVSGPADFERYAELPDYPFDGCPTVEDLERAFAESRPADGDSAGNPSFRELRQP